LGVNVRRLNYPFDLPMGDPYRPTGNLKLGTAPGKDFAGQGIVASGNVIGGNTLW
jgi:hypothetical protein